MTRKTTAKKKKSSKAAARRAATRKPAAKKPAAKMGSPEKAAYTPKPIKGTGWAPFRYNPPQ
jgi:hypothetical protein